MDLYLKATRYVDYLTPEVQHVAKQILSDQGHTRSSNLPDGERQRRIAVAVHNYVRDNILFGFSTSFWNQSASAVLKYGKGFCNTQSTVFVALLRACGIPARQHFVSITSKILHGLVSPPAAFVEHSYAEVYLNNTWIKTDSYIMDPKLFHASKARLKADGLLVGYGVSISGSNEWDGCTDSFSQFYLSPDWSNKIALSDADYGVFEDVGEFNTKVKRGGEWAPRVYFFFLNECVNRTIDGVRLSTESL